MNANLIFIATYLVIGCFSFDTWRKHKDKDFLYLFLLSIPVILDRVLKNFPANFIYQSSNLKFMTDILFLCLGILYFIVGIRLLMRGLINK